MTAVSQQHVGPEPVEDLLAQGTVQCRAFPGDTEAKLRPLARFVCSMVWRLTSTFMAVRQPAEAGAPTNRDLRNCCDP